MKIISWNVNGIRAVANKGFVDWVMKEKADIVCLQETKALEEQVPRDIRALPYHQTYAMGVRKGYSGVAVLSREKPLKISTELGSAACDGEGRIIQAEYERFVLLNVYFPNGKSAPERLAYKMKFYAAFLAHCDKLVKKRKKVLFCGDVNTAHTEKDLARPKENEATSGFLPEERAWIDACIEHGYHDTLRMFTDKGALYTWWDFKTRARERNIGWRIDYMFVSDSLKPYVEDAWIDADVTGSDHCPIGITLKW